jgi:hypothetical protein
MVANRGVGAMKSLKISKIVGRIYDNVEIALWAMLLAFVMYFVAFIVPNVPEIQARGERIRAEEIAAENALFCEKLGTIRGTEKYNQCLLDVGAFRLKVEKRINDENEF